VLHFEGSAAQEEDIPTLLEHMDFSAIGDDRRTVPLDRVPRILLSECWCDLHDIARLAGAAPPA
jgi:hypothetical protein